MGGGGFPNKKSMLSTKASLTAHTTFSRSATIRRGFKSSLNVSGIVGGGSVGAPATINNLYDRFSLEENINEKRKKRQEVQWFKFLSVLIEIAIEKFPKNIELKIINSFN